MMRTTRHGSATVDPARRHHHPDHPHLRGPSRPDMGDDHHTPPRAAMVGPDLVAPRIVPDRSAGRRPLAVRVRQSDGTELAWHGVYPEIEPTSRIVSTEVFEGYPDGEAVTTTTLTEADGLTTLRTLVEHTSQSNRDGHLSSGMESGMHETFNRLEDLLAIADTTAEQFRRVAGRFTDRAHSVPAGSWDAPTPCEGWVARGIVTHMVTWMPAVIGQSGLDTPVIPPVEDDPVAAWEALADGFQAMLDNPAVAAVEFDAGPPGRLSVESPWATSCSTPGIWPGPSDSTTPSIRSPDRAQHVRRHGTHRRHATSQRPLRAGRDAIRGRRPDLA